jgi:hypothetical protein
MHVNIIGYKRVGDCTYPKLTCHTLRSENVKLIQLIKAIKSNIDTEKNLNNTCGGRYEELRENKESKGSEEERKKNEGMRSREEKRSEEEREIKEEKEINGARKNEEERESEKETASNDKINREQDQSILILQDRTQIASDDHHDVLDVD